MKPLLFGSVFAYLLISSYFFINWLKFFKQKPTQSPEDFFLSLVLLVIATILWPIAGLVSCLKFLEASKFWLGSIIPTLLAIFLISILIYL